MRFIHLKNIQNRQQVLVGCMGASVLGFNTVVLRNADVNMGHNKKKTIKANTTNWNVHAIWV